MRQTTGTRKSPGEQVGKASCRSVRSEGFNGADFVEKVV